jgi:cellulose synthase/poly-beta-1,6-N-acetylglucosamine synthase-like glycosyltransferase
MSTTCCHSLCRLPGAFAWGYIACTGTNFCIRVRALAHCGWFPEYTITEDYALGMELKVISVEMYGENWGGGLGFT